MAKKTRMGRNLNALLGGATRNRAADATNTEAADSANESSNTQTTVSTPITPSVTTDSSTMIGATNGTRSEQSSDAKPSGSNQTSENGGFSADAEKNTATVSAQSDAGPAAAQSVGEKLAVQADSHPSDRLRMLGVDQITRGMYQPRRHFDQDLLQELADSIKAQGLIQPILVRAYGGKFELIAGERRWRASQLAGITDIPAIVRDMDDQSVAAVSLIENIQRADLNPLEEAQALERLCGEFSMTHQQVAEAVGRSRVAVTNLMRLLELHDVVKGMVDNGELDMGHARALLGAPRNDQPDIAKRITQQGLTVRAVEKLVRDLREGKTSTPAETQQSDPNITALGQKLGKQLGAPVNIRHNKNGSGKLEISYTSVDELDGILKHIK